MPNLSNHLRSMVVGMHTVGVRQKDIAIRLNIHKNTCQSLFHKSFQPCVKQTHQRTGNGRLWEGRGGMTNSIWRSNLLKLRKAKKRVHLLLTRTALKLRKLSTSNFHIMKIKDLPLFESWYEVNISLLFQKQARRKNDADE